MQFQTHRGKLYSLMSTVPLLFTADEWQNKRIYLDDDMKKYFNEFYNIERLKDPKLVENINSECYYNKNGGGNFNQEDEEWEFYVQKDNMITWRREEDIGQYAYKGELHVLKMNTFMFTKNPLYLLDIYLLFFIVVLVIA